MAAEASTQPDDKKRLWGIPITKTSVVVVGIIVSIIVAIITLFISSYFLEFLGASVLAILAAIAAIIGTVAKAVQILNFLLNLLWPPPPPSPSVQVNINISSPLPFIDPSYFYHDDKMIKDIYTKLLQDDLTALVLTGSSGIGKSTVAAFVYQYAKQQRLTGQEKRFNAEPLWLSVAGGTTISELTSRVMRFLDKRIPSFDMLPPQNQVQSLINALSTISEQESRIVFLDQFEYLLKKRELSEDNVGIDTLLDMLNRKVFSNPNCRVVFTGEHMLSEIEGYPPMHIKEYPIPPLKADQSVEFLQQLLKQQEVDKLENINEEQSKGLENVISNYHGHALSLTLLSAILGHKKGPTLAEFIQDPTYAQLGIGNPVEHLLNYIYHELLDQKQRQLLLAFSVFREPVDLETANKALPPDNQASQDALNGLLACFLLLSAGRKSYQLHSLIAKFAQRQFAEGSADDPTTLAAAHARVASYYENRAASVASPELGRRADTLHSLVEATWHYCHAHQWTKAYALMEREKVFSKLFRLGRASTLLELYTLLLPLDKWRPNRLQVAAINNELGEIYIALEMYERAIPFFEFALPRFREERNTPGEIRALSNLGKAYRLLGQEKLFRIEIEMKGQDLLRYPDTQEPHKQRWKFTDVNTDLQKALNYLEEADRSNEGDSIIAGQTYYNLGLVHYLLVQQEQPHEQAKRYTEEALTVYRGLRASLEEARTLYHLGCILIAQKEWVAARATLNQTLTLQREIGDRKGEGTTLDRLGRLYDDIGEDQKSWRSYEQAWQIEIEVGDRRGLAITFHNIGALYSKQALSKKMLEEMLAFLHHAQKIFEQIHHPIKERAERNLHKLREQFGNQAFVDLQKEVEPKTSEIIKQAKGPAPTQESESPDLLVIYPARRAHRAASTEDRANAGNATQDGGKPPVKDVQGDASEQAPNVVEQDASPV